MLTGLRLATRALIKAPQFTAVALIVLTLGLGAKAGVYGVMSYSIALRAHEIGVRLALGGQPRDIAALLVGHGMRLTVAGLALGLGGRSSCECKA